MYFLWHFYSSISAAISLRSVYCWKKKTSKTWILTSIEVFLTSRQRWASPRCFHQRHSQDVTESHMCFICHNKVAGVFAVALIQLTTTPSTLTTVTTPTAPIIPKWLLRLLLLKKCYHSRRWLMITIYRKKQIDPPESLTTEERAFPEELFSASWVPNQCGESLTRRSKVSHHTPFIHHPFTIHLLQVCSYCGVNS